jgi:hypothetical protein
MLTVVDELTLFPGIGSECEPSSRLVHVSNTELVASLVEFSDIAPPRKHHYTVSIRTCYSAAINCLVKQVLTYSQNLVKHYHSVLENSMLNLIM